MVLFFCSCEFNFLRLRNAVIVPQMAGCLHAEGATIFVTEPPGERGDINAALDADRCEQVAKNHGCYHALMS